MDQLTSWSLNSDNPVLSQSDDLIIDALRLRGGVLGHALKSMAKAGTGPLARTLTGAAPRILMYHRFGAADGRRRLSVRRFEQQLQYLTRHFRVRRLTDVATALRDGRPVEDRTVVLTVDDGYADFAAYAYPLLQRYRVPVTLFAAIDLLDGQRWLWFDANHYVIHTTRVIRHDFRIDATTVLPLDLSSGPARGRAWSAVGERCLRMDADQRAAVLQRLQDELDVSLPRTPTSDYQGMTWEDAGRMDPGLVQFGAHTCTHPVLSRCDTPEIEHEVRESKRVIEARLHTPVSAFCYPHGEPDDYDDRTVEAVEAAGYLCATVAHGGPIGLDADLYRLERIGAPQETLSFRSEVNGVTALADRWRTWRHAATS